MISCQLSPHERPTLPQLLYKLLYSDWRYALICTPVVIRLLHLSASTPVSQSIYFVISNTIVCQQDLSSWTSLAGVKAAQYGTVLSKAFFLLWCWISALAFAKLALRWANSLGELAGTGRWAFNLYHKNIIINYHARKNVNSLFGCENIFSLYWMVLPRGIFTSASLLIWAVLNYYFCGGYRRGAEKYFMKQKSAVL